MKRTMLFVVLGIFCLFCEVGYSQWGGWYYPSFYPFGGYGYGYGYNTNCANGQCSTCPNGKCNLKKDDADDKPEAEEEVKSEAPEAEESVPEAVETASEEKPEADTGVSTADLVVNESLESGKELVVPIPEVIEGEGEATPIPDTVPEANQDVPKEEETIVVEAVPIPTFTARVLELVNWHRSQVGLPPLTVDSNLVLGCQRHSRYMASYGFGHASGIGAMECIAMGVSTPEAVVNMWLSSSGHRAIIMSRGTKIGFGSWGSFHTLRVR